MCKCNVKDCQNPADYLVLLVDYYPVEEDFFVEIDNTCPLLCAKHKDENEKKAQGHKKARATINYPYTNKTYGQGITAYIPLKQVKQLVNTK